MPQLDKSTFIFHYLYLQTPILLITNNSRWFKLIKFTTFLFLYYFFFFSILYLWIIYLRASYLENINLSNNIETNFCNIPLVNALSVNLVSEIFSKNFFYHFQFDLLPLFEEYSWIKDFFLQIFPFNFLFMEVVYASKINPFDPTYAELTPQLHIDYSVFEEPAWYNIPVVGKLWKWMWGIYPYSSSGRLSFTGPFPKKPLITFENKFDFKSVDDGSLIDYINAFKVQEPVSEPQSYFSWIVSTVKWALWPNLNKEEPELVPFEKDPEHVHIVHEVQNVKYRPELLRRFYYYKRYDNLQYSTYLDVENRYKRGSIEFLQNWYHGTNASPTSVRKKWFLLEHLHSRIMSGKLHSVEGIVSYLNYLFIPVSSNALNRFNYMEDYIESFVNEQLRSAEGTDRSIKYKFDEKIKLFEAILEKIDYVSKVLSEEKEWKEALERRQYFKSIFNKEANYLGEANACDFYISLPEQIFYDAIKKNQTCVSSNNFLLIADELRVKFEKITRDITLFSEKGRPYFINPNNPEDMKNFSNIDPEGVLSRNFATDITSNQILYNQADRISNYCQAHSTALEHNLSSSQLALQIVNNALNKYYTNYNKYAETCHHMGRKEDIINYVFKGMYNINRQVSHPELFSIYTNFGNACLDIRLRLNEIKTLVEDREAAKGFYSNIFHNSYYEYIDRGKISFNSNVDEDISGLQGAYPIDLNSIDNSDKLSDIFNGFHNDQVLSFLRLVDLEFKHLEFGNVLKHSETNWKTILPSFLELFYNERQSIIYSLNKFYSWGAIESETGKIVGAEIAKESPEDTDDCLRLLSLAENNRRRMVNFANHHFPGFIKTIRYESADLGCIKFKTLEEITREETYRNLFRSYSDSELLIKIILAKISMTDVEQHVNMQKFIYSEFGNNNNLKNRSTLGNFCRAFGRSDLEEIKDNAMFNGKNPVDTFIKDKLRVFKNFEEYKFWFDHGDSVYGMNEVEKEFIKAEADAAAKYLAAKEAKKEAGGSGSESKKLSKILAKEVTLAKNLANAKEVLVVAQREAKEAAEELIQAELAFKMVKELKTKIDVNKVKVLAESRAEETMKIFEEAKEAVKVAEDKVTESKVIKDKGKDKVTESKVIKDKGKDKVTTKVIVIKDNTGKVTKKVTEFYARNDGKFIEKITEIKNKGGGSEFITSKELFDYTPVPKPFHSGGIQDFISGFGHEFFKESERLLPPVVRCCTSDVKGFKVFIFFENKSPSIDPKSSFCSPFSFIPDHADISRDHFSHSTISDDELDDGGLGLPTIKEAKERGLSDFRSLAITDDAPVFSSQDIVETRYGAESMSSDDRNIMYDMAEEGPSEIRVEKNPANTGRYSTFKFTTKKAD